MINPSIESSDFLFWQQKNFNQIFENFLGNRQSRLHEFKFSVCVCVCVYTHTLNFKFS